MAEFFRIHPLTPHRERIFEVSDRLKAGAIALIPTDSQYALGCIYTNKKGIERIRQIRHLGRNHLFTLICDSMSGLSKFALISDENFKIIKRLIPGPFTFVLPATKEVPKLLLNPRRKTIGFRIPDYPICQEIVKELGNPLLSTTARPPDQNGEEDVYLQWDELRDLFEKRVDVIVDGQRGVSKQKTTVIDMTGEHAVILRPGSGIEKVGDIFNQYDKELIL